MKTAWVCPHCGTKNYTVIASGETSASFLRLLRCDSDDGGCDEYVPATLYRTVTYSVEFINVKPVQQGA